jgi:hypothetical protein
MQLSPQGFRRSRAAPAARLRRAGYAREVRRWLLLSLAVGGCLVTATPGVARPLPGAPSCPIFPRDNAWNRRVDHLPVAVAANGSDWYISGAPDPRWDNDDLHTLHRVPGSAFEVVDASVFKPRRVGALQLVAPARATRRR